MMQVKKKCVFYNFLRVVTVLLCWVPVHVIAGNTTTVAGNPSVDIYGYYAGGFQDGYSNVAQFSLPRDVIVDGAGNIYIADTLNHRIRKMDALGNVTTVAGTGVAGDVPPAITPLVTATTLTAQFNEPRGLALDALGNLYVADSMNHCIRKITPAGIVSTYAGKGPLKPGFADALIPSLAKFLYPSALAIDVAGNLYVADTWNNLIRKVTPLGVVTTYAGELLLIGGFPASPPGAYMDGLATVARFDAPSDIVLDAVGNLYVADTNNQRIRKVDTLGNVTTLAGHAAIPNPSGQYAGGFADGNSMTQALFSWPQGLALDASGNVLVSDTVNHRIRMINSITGNVMTIAGSGVGGFADGWTTGSQLWQPVGIAVDTTGKVYVADAWNQRIRTIDLVDLNNTAPAPTAPVIHIKAGQVGQSQVMANDADIPMNTIVYRVNAVPRHGSVIVSTTGLATYTPNVGYFGQDNFIIAASDQYEATGVVTVDVTVDFAPIPLSANTSSGCLIASNSELLGFSYLMFLLFVAQFFTGYGIRFKRNVNQ